MERRRCVPRFLEPYRTKLWPHVGREGKRVPSLVSRDEKRFASLKVETTLLEEPSAVSSPSLRVGQLPTGRQLGKQASEIGFGETCVPVPALLTSSAALSKWRGRNELFAGGSESPHWAWGNKEGLELGETEDAEVGGCRMLAGFLCLRKGGMRFPIRCRCPGLSDVGHHVRNPLTRQCTSTTAGCLERSTRSGDWHLHRSSTR